jgi:hypothetical protein
MPDGERCGLREAAGQEERKQPNKGSPDGHTSGSFSVVYRIAALARVGRTPVCRSAREHLRCALRAKLRSKRMVAKADYYPPCVKLYLRYPDGVRDVS